MEQVRNRFAEAVRRIAAFAPSVDAGVMKAGKAMAVGIALLAAPVVYHQGLSPMSQDAIKGAAEAARTATDAAATARRQGEFSAYYSCGLLKVAKADLGNFTERSGVSALKALAGETLYGAARMAAPSSSLGQTVAGVATMAKTLGMAGLSSAAEAIIGGADNEGWASHWRSELSSVGETIVRSTREARTNRDIVEIANASVEIDEAYESIGCGPKI